MEQTAAPPPQPPSISAVTTTTTATLDSSPPSRKPNSYGEENSLFPSNNGSTAATAAATGGLTKLRLMCSYGGHIVPRPHDKSLCYIGGDTRIVAVDRHTTLSDLTNRLAKTLLLRSPPPTTTSSKTTDSFIVKYQLPSEDLDSLISVTTDEDLENMIDEYERLNLNSDAGKSSRLRLFLFPAKPELNSISSIGSLLESSTKSEDWFLNALNGSSLGFSDTTSVNCLLGLEEEVLIPEKKIQDVQSVPDSPMLETTSSFGSASSSPSLANLPPVRVNGDDHQKVLKHQDDVGFVTAPAPVVIAAVSVVSKVAIVENPNPKQQRFDLASPDSVSSDGSVTNPLSRRKPTLIYQDPITQTQFSTNNNNNNNNRDDQIQNNRIPTIQQQQPPQQIQDSAYLMSTSTPQVDPPQSQPQPHPQLHHQSQFIHTAVPPPPQYIHHHPSGAAVPMGSYYPMYPSQNQHHAPHPALDQHNFVYYMPTRPPPNNQVPPPSGLLTVPRTVQTATKTEPPTGVYRTANSGAQAPQLVQLPSSQHPQYVSYSHIHQPSQSVASSAAGNYAYEFADHPLQQGQHIYYAAPQAAAQYQTMASTLPVEVGSHVQTDNRTSQQP